MCEASHLQNLAAMHLATNIALNQSSKDTDPKATAVGIKPSQLKHEHCTWIRLKGQSPSIHNKILKDYKTDDQDLLQPEAIFKALEIRSSAKLRPFKTEEFITDDHSRVHMQVQNLRPEIPSLKYDSLVRIHVQSLFKTRDCHAHVEQKAFQEIFQYNSLMQVTIFSKNPLVHLCSQTERNFIGKFSTHRGDATQTIRHRRTQHGNKCQERIHSTICSIRIVVLLWDDNTLHYQVFQQDARYSLPPKCESSKTVCLEPSYLQIFLS